MRAMIDGVRVVATNARDGCVAKLENSQFVVMFPDGYTELFHKYIGSMYTEFSVADIPLDFEHAWPLFENGYPIRSIVTNDVKHGEASFLPGEIRGLWIILEKPEKEGL